MPSCADLETFVEEAAGSAGRRSDCEQLEEGRSNGIATSARIGCRQKGL